MLKPRFTDNDLPGAKKKKKNVPTLFGEVLLWNIYTVKERWKDQPAEKMPFRCSGLPVKFQAIVPNWNSDGTRCCRHLCAALQPFLRRHQATIYSLLFAVGLSLWNQRRPGLCGGSSLNLTSACEEGREWFLVLVHSRSIDLCKSPKLCHIPKIEPTPRVRVWLLNTECLIVAQKT